MSISSTKVAALQNAEVCVLYVLWGLTGQAACKLRAATVQALRAGQPMNHSRTGFNKVSPQVVVRSR